MAPNYGPKIVTNGLVLCLDAANRKSYPGSGTTWKDLSKNGNDGTLVNGVGFSAENNGYMGFDGVDDFVGFTSFNFGNELTVICFVNPLETNNIQTLFANSAGGLSTNGIRLFMNRFLNNTRSITIEVGNGSSGDNTTTTSNNLVLYGVWQHIAFTLSKNTGLGIIYYNGSPITSGNLSVINYNANNPFRLGRFTDGQFPLHGKVSTYNIYNRALTAAEIRQNYNALKGRYGL